MPEVQPLSVTSEPVDFETVFHQYWPSIHRLLIRMVGDVDEAQDLAHEAFLRLHRRPGLLAAGQNPGGWLYRVASNLGYNALRSRRRRRQYEIEAGRRVMESNAALDPGHELERTEERAQVRTILGAMKPRSARILILRQSGLTYAELAATLNLAPASVGKVLARAELEFERKYRQSFLTMETPDASD